ncbi:questin oxidase family protein [Streptomyces sp. NPDC006798]|uniref:questin oxidase family protein n=1 Tax=Streptomyces sp. NPDC006798 TaxID=3155462 RepID=UPI0033C536CE
MSTSSHGEAPVPVPAGTASAPADTGPGPAPAGSGPASAPPGPDSSGRLDEALERIHTLGPEFDGWLSNHAPMAVEALVRHGRSDTVHRWLDRYRERLEDMPAPATPITAGNWREALGDPRRITDWALYFERETADRPWREVLAEWWPLLLPGIAGGATHPAIRVGHAVRTLLTTEETAPRVAELAHGLGYWAARHDPLPAGVRFTGSPADATAALGAVTPVPDQSAGIRRRLAQLTALPDWPNTPAAPGSPEEAETRLRGLVAAATHRYATHGHAEPVMLVHAATAPNAVLRTLPALPRELWAPSLDAAWAASAAVTAAYAPAGLEPWPGAGHGSAPGSTRSGTRTPEEIFAAAAAHGDDHTIKFTDTALDVGDPLALIAAGRSIDLNEPLL